MHELHLAQDILAKICKAKSGKVAHVIIGLGQARFTHLQELKELLADISKGTGAEGAKIDFKIIPIKAACAACKKEFIPENLRLNCAHCGSTDIQMVSGNELNVLGVA
jgi:hydrogenase nickel insertion protein HypA